MGHARRADVRGSGAGVRGLWALGGVGVLEARSAGVCPGGVAGVGEAERAGAGDDAEEKDVGQGGVKGKSCETRAGKFCIC